MRTRNEAIADAIAKKIMANTRKRFSTLHSEALQEIQMSTVTTSNDLSKNLNGTSQVGSPADGKKFNNDTVQNSQVNVGPTKYVDGLEFDGARGGDTRKVAAPAVIPPQPAPRAENNDAKGA